MLVALRVVVIVGLALVTVRAKLAVWEALPPEHVTLFM